MRMQGIEDEQLYDCDSDPVTVDLRMQSVDGKCMVYGKWHDRQPWQAPRHGLGLTDHQFSFTTKDSVDLLGITIDKQLLNFTKQAFQICKKVKDQLNVMTRFLKHVSTSTILK